MPLMPSGLYFAEGFVISSICFMDDDGICCNNWVASIFDGFPSIRILTLVFPLRLISLVCGSILTVGMLFMISDAVLPEAIKSFPILITFLSIFCTMVERSPIISTPFSCTASSSSAIALRVTLFVVAFKVIVSVSFLYPMNRNSIVYVSKAKFLIEKFPLSCVMPPLIILSANLMLMFTYGIGCFEFLSTTFPEMLPGLSAAKAEVWALRKGMVLKKQKSKILNCMIFLSDD